MSQYIYKVYSLFEISENMKSCGVEVYVETRRQRVYTFAEACGVASAINQNLCDHSSYHWTDAYPYKALEGDAQGYVVVRYKVAQREYEG